MIFESINMEELLVPTGVFLPFLLQCPDPNSNFQKTTGFHMLPLHVSKKKMLLSIGTCQVTDLPTFNESFSRTSFFSGMFQGSSGPYKTSLEQKLFQTWQSLFIPFPFKKNMLSKKQMWQNLNSLGGRFFGAAG